jgi:HPt (histidine-containing phosphotransfer) domain-containing protein
MPSSSVRSPSLDSTGDDRVRPPAGAPTSAWTDVLDGAALARLAELDPKGQAGLVTRVISTYTQSLARLLAELARARGGNDVEALRHVAHTLKSSSASVGALQLSRLCADIERKVTDRRSEDLDAQLEAMAREGDRVLAALTRHAVATPRPA